MFLELLKNKQSYEHRTLHRTSSILGTTLNETVTGRSVRTTKHSSQTETVCRHADCFKVGKRNDQTIGRSAVLQGVHNYFAITSYYSLCVLNMPIFCYSILSLLR
ncbi:hypothetical protein AB6A40_009126 [Gnathostoma spinigerum]|uniref:Uncharacterized protein n=1 Tax=Gnathostoma spinigerum TaxID=75299 RepID=A0ABD6F075_9BILA